MQSLIRRSFHQPIPLAVITVLVAITSFISGAHATAGPRAAPAASVVYLPAVMRSTSRIYWGALVDGVPPSSAALQPGGAIDAFETRARKKLAIVHWGQSWKRSGSDQVFPRSYFVNARNHGSIPMLSWGSQVAGDGVAQPDFRLSAIYAGRHDSYVRQWALDAKAWGHPFFLRFDWEMNGNWQFPWSEQVNGNQPGDYIKAWRHVHDIFTQAGATNVTWVWCPNISGATTLPMASVYPGDSYVDWTCLDGYNRYNTWLNFNTIFSGSGITWLYNSYEEILRVAPTKPIMIGEVASREAGDGGAKKGAWITDTFTRQLPNTFPKIQAVVWFNWDANDPVYATMPIESSQSSISAFAAAIGSRYYAANDFANLDTSPIRPLP